MPNTGLYVFGIVTAGHPCRLGGLKGVGGPGVTVWRVVAARTAAVVCVAPAQPLAMRRDLLAHREVVNSLWQQGPVLPIRFGLAAPSREVLRGELLALQGRHMVALTEVTGRAEINVKLVPDEELLARDVAGTDPRVRELANSANGGYFDRLRLDEAVAAAVRERRSAHTAQIKGELIPCSVRTAADPWANSFSFLVSDDRVGEFLDRAKVLATRLEPQCQLRITGPLPAYSFTDWP